MMALILLLIVAVAAFNTVAMLVMVVNDKRTDIAILRTFGASPRSICRSSSPRASRSAGSAWPRGLVLGIVLALNVDTIVPVLERLFHFQFLDAQVYYITTIPSEVHAPEVVWISAAALLLTLRRRSIRRCARRARRPPMRCATSSAMALPYEWMIGMRYLRARPRPRLSVVHLRGLDARAGDRRGGADRGAVGHERLRARA